MYEENSLKNTKCCSSEKSMQLQKHDLHMVFATLTCSSTFFPLKKIALRAPNRVYRYDTVYYYGGVWNEVPQIRRG